MDILIACEESGEVREAFAERGHNAWSCDILPSRKPGNHIQGTILSHEILKRHWDMLIAFPDCTFLASSGARHMSTPWRKEAQMQALYFVRALWAFPIERKALENPIGRLSTLWMKPTQIIQPWMFGHGETKATCLWLDNLPPLQPTNVVPERENRVWKMAPSATRGRDRAKTFPGIAKAMAEQWG